MSNDPSGFYKAHGVKAQVLEAWDQYFTKNFPELDELLAQAQMSLPHGPRTQIETSIAHYTLRAHQIGLEAAIREMYADNSVPQSTEVVTP